MLGLKYYHKPELSGLTAAKNFGIDQAIGEIILFLDDDVVLLPGFLNELLSGIEHGFDGVSGVQIQDSSNKSKMSEIYSTIFQRGYLRDRRRYINRNFNRLPRYVSSQVLSGGLTAYRRDLLISERFDTNLVSYCLGEDKEYSLRVSVKGAKLAICTKALAFHFRHPEGKPNPIERYEAKTALVKYLQTRNEQVTGKKNLWASNWALFGIFVEACFVGAKSRSLQPIKGVFSGLRKAKQEGYRTKVYQFRNLVVSISDIYKSLQEQKQEQFDNCEVFHQTSVCSVDSIFLRLNMSADAVGYLH